MSEKKNRVKSALAGEAWGNRYEPPTEQRFQRELHRIINEPSDLDRVEQADPTHPSLVEQLDAIERVVAEIGDEVDILHTVFNISAARFADYPVDIFSWDDRGKGNPTISGFRKLTDKTLMAGLPHRRIHKLASDALVESVFESVG